jgi:hemerythrin-like domain-containing protein
MQKLSPNSLGEKAFSDELANTIARLQALLAAHQEKEEEVLYSIVEEQLGSDASLAMSKEHEQIMTTLHELRKLVISPRNKALESTSAEFEAIVRRHFWREENVLFWFASLLMNSETADTAGIVWKQGT